MGQQNTFPCVSGAGYCDPWNINSTCFCKSRVVSSVSVFAHLYGQHDYDDNPWAPLGTAVKMHVMSAQRRTFSTHTKSGFYIGNSGKQYRYHQVWLPKTRATSVAKTVFFNHTYLIQPSITTSDAILRATDTLSEALTGVLPTRLHALWITSARHSQATQQQRRQRSTPSKRNSTTCSLKGLTTTPSQRRGPSWN